MVAVVLALCLFSPLAGAYTALLEQLLVNYDPLMRPGLRLGSPCKDGDLVEVQFYVENLHSIGAPLLPGHSGQECRAVCWSTDPRSTFVHTRVSSDQKKHLYI